MSLALRSNEPNAKQALRNSRSRPILPVRLVIHGPSSHSSHCLAGECKNFLLWTGFNVCVTRYQGHRSPAKSTDPIGPISGDHTLVFPAQKGWTSNHGSKGPVPVHGQIDLKNSPAGVNEAFSDGHAEWVNQSRFERAGPNLNYAKARWASGWPWDWAWVE